MVQEQLEPRLELLRQEYVLIQAWKKTASYIRYHSWFSDTLALDYASVNLPSFLGEIRERLESAESWHNDPLRIVPAPKSQPWRVQDGAWGPTQGRSNWERIRPLAHVRLADQVVATALMLCLADRVETLQGDPRRPIRNQASRRRVVSYGNRLFCDAMGDELRHRWGATKLYRAYFQDYRKFISRPGITAESIGDAEHRRVYVIHADLRQFYDRVRPEMLAKAIERIRCESDDPAFFSLMTSVFNWCWHSSDEGAVRSYAKHTGIEDFTQVVLPQGLVASGFFANVVLLSFDEALRRAIGTEIAPGVLLADSCRYVDDFRTLVTIAPNLDIASDDLKIAVANWLSQLLDENADGLALSREKTQIAALGSGERSLVRQGPKMNRIQSAVSGGFDALAGDEILDSILGLMHEQEALGASNDCGWRLSPVPDVRDDTVARFGATRYRKTFRSIRPLLQDDDVLAQTGTISDDIPPGKRLRVARTRIELDQHARAFALRLIRRWIADPSNVRLLRIGLDLWPDVELLREVLSLLRPFTQERGRRKASRRVAWYCLTEVLRAGATETGLVEDNESLPSGIDLESYREELCDEAARLVSLPSPTIPWYIRQQALLFLATFDSARAPEARKGTRQETRGHWKLIRFLRGEGDVLRSSDFATFAILARRAFKDRTRALELTRPHLNSSRERQIAQRDPSFLLELIDNATDAFLFDDLPVGFREVSSRTMERSSRGSITLAEAILSTHPSGCLRNELSLLRFAMAFLDQWEQQEVPPEVITPDRVLLRVGEDLEVADILDLRLLEGQADTPRSPFSSRYRVAEWCGVAERWRLQLGFLLRFILSGQPDFTCAVRRQDWKEGASYYRPAESHWYQRLYGLSSGQPAFGDDWLPISDWAEGFLLALMRWPGCCAPEEFRWVEQGIQEARVKIHQRLATLESLRGNATKALILPLVVKRPILANEVRPLRACVVQMAIPKVEDFCRTDLALNRSAIRRRHRNHLSTALAAVERMLALRATHMETEEWLDWLILPELAVHPKDVRTHLIPFARAHRAMILAGLTYEEVLTGEPLVNSALWVIPERTAAHGLQIKIRRQGKAHLAPDEKDFNRSGVRLVQGFRPCQWLIGYPWSGADRSQHVQLTAAVCYDATDLGLAADLRHVSDVLAVPALNRDVKTFDQMAEALHYHMFQLVVVANNGEYGGSNAYWPRKDARIRQVFHMHGQPQASVAFFEIDNIDAYLARHDLSGANPYEWKHPPAGPKFISPGGSQ